MLKLWLWKTDYGRGPRKLFIYFDSAHAVTLGEFIRNPREALRVLAGKAGEGQ